MEVQAASALHRVHAPRLPFRWSLNPYRGCAHGCAYCYARRTHTFLDLSAAEQFSSRILVKTNLPELLRRELARPTWRRERVALGTATDAYQPAEGRYRITRAALEALLHYRTPISLVTKSPLVLRDLDLLSKLHRVAGVQVHVSLISLDRGLQRALEPGAPPPAARLEALRRLNESGIPAGLMLAPILPGLTDGVASLTAVIQAAHRAGARSLGYQALRLCDGAREVYLDRLREHLPDLEVATQKLYRGREYVPRGYLLALERRLRTILRRFPPIPGPRTVYRTLDAPEPASAGPLPAAEEGPGTHGALGAAATRNKAGLPVQTLLAL